MKQFLEVSPISKLGELGTGRDPATVFVVDEDFKIMDKTKVLNNWPSKNIVRLSSGKLYNHETQMIDGLKVKLYRWSLPIEVAWQKKEPMQKLERFFDSASVKQIILVKQRVTELQGRNEAPEDYERYRQTLGDRYVDSYLQGRLTAEIAETLQMFDPWHLRELASFVETLNGDKAE